MSQPLLVSDLQALLLNQGRWWGSVQEAQFCVRDGCMVWPRQVAAVEQVALCGAGLEIRSPWYGFNRPVAEWRACGGCSSGVSGSAQVGRCRCGHYHMSTREGTAASFATTLGANKVIRSYPGGLEDLGKKITYQGRDANGIEVRTVIDGVIQSGEQVVLASPFVDTTTVWGPGSPTAVVKERTSWRVLVYEYDTVTGLERQLADYEPGETRPSYRVSYVPGLRGEGGCGNCTTGADTTRKTVTAMVSLQHVELFAPNDWLILQNLSAYKAAMIAVKAWEDGDVARGDYYFYGTQAGGRNARGVTRVVNRGGAIPLLQAELRKMSADRTNINIVTDPSDKFARVMCGYK